MTDDKTDAAVRDEKEERAHDRVSPAAMLDPLAAVNLYVETFVAGARFAASHGGASR